MLKNLLQVSCLESKTKAKRGRRNWTVNKMQYDYPKLPNTDMCNNKDELNNLPSLGPISHKPDVVAALPNNNDSDEFPTPKKIIFIYTSASHEYLHYVPENNSSKFFLSSSLLLR